MWEYINIVIKVGWKILINYPRIRKYVKHPERYPIEERFNNVRGVIKKVLDTWPVEYRLKDFEKFNNFEGKRLIVMNHLSFLDSLAFISICEKPIILIAKKEVEKYFMVGDYLKAIGGLFLDRENLMNQMRTLSEAMKVAKDPNGSDVVIFPEGTRNKVPGTRCLDFKAGTFKIAMKSGVAIFPVSVYGAFRPLDTKIHLKKYPIYITCFDPILPEEYETKNSFEIASFAQNLIDQNIQEMKKVDLEYINSLKLSDKMKDRATVADRIEF